MPSTSSLRKMLSSGLAVLLALGSIFIAASPASAAPTAQECHYAAEGQGAYSQTLCWLDMSGYSDIEAGATGGQQMVLSIAGGYTLTYTLQRTGRQMASSPLPIIATAFLGNVGHYAGIAGQSGLYQVNRAVDPATSSTLRMTNISLTDANGAAVTAFSIVGVDAEQTTTGESIAWTSDKPLNQLIPIGNACNSGFTGVGTTTVFCSANNTNNRSGTAMLSAEDPNSLTQTMQNTTTGRQGVAFAVLLSKVRIDKFVQGRVDPSDDFKLFVETQTGIRLATANTGPNSTATTGNVETIGTTTSSSFLLGEDSTPTNLDGYNSFWNCTRNGQQDSSLPSGPVGATVLVTPELGDLIACTIVNEARPTGLTLQKTALPPNDVNNNDITDAGDTIGFEFELTNSGELPLQDFDVNDALVGPVTCPAVVLFPGDRTVCTSVSDYVITAADAAQGFVINNAQANAHPTISPVTVTSNTSSTYTPVTPAAPALSLTKSVSPTAITTAGELVNYGFEITNTGNVLVSGISVSETSFTGSGTSPTVTCPLTQLYPGSSTTCTASYVATQADIDGGGFTNTAQAVGTANGPVGSALSSATVTAAATAALSLAKSVAPNDAASFTLGENLTYTFVVTNTGNVTVNGVSINEVAFSGSGAPPTVSCGPAAATLAPGAQVTCSASYVITQPDIDSSTLTNRATAGGTAPGGGPVTSPEASAAIPAAPGPQLEITKTAAPDIATATGQTINYTFRVANAGNVTLTNIAVFDTAFSGSGSLSPITCPAGVSLLPGEALLCTASYVTTQQDVDAGIVTNDANATADAPDGALITSPTSTATVTISPIESLNLLKVASPGQVSNVGDAINYSFVVKNTGTVTITGVSIEDSAFSGTGTAPSITCPAGAASLAPNATVTCTAPYSTTHGDIDAGSVSNTAVAFGTPAGGGRIDSNASSALVNVPDTPNLTIIKVASVSTVSEVGDTIDYSFTVTNTGNVTLSDVRIIEGLFTGVGAVQAPVCPAAAASLAPGQVVVCTSTATVTQSDIDAGVVSNTATATGTSPQRDKTPLAPPSTVDVLTIVAPALSVIKTVSPMTVSAAGQTVLYSFVVENTGNTTLSDVGVTEQQFTGTGTPPVVTCPVAAAQLAPGASVTCSAPYTLTQADIDAGSVGNAALGHGLAPRATTPIESAPADATLTASAAPALTLIKSANPATYEAGQVIEYSFLITNTGNLTLLDVAAEELAFTGTGARPKIFCPASLTLMPEESATCTARYVATQADVEAGHVDNAASASGVAAGPSSQPVSSLPSSAVVAASVLPPNLASLTLTKSADHTELTRYSAGTVISYTFVVSNVGQIGVTGVTVSETSFSGSGPTPSITCPIGATTLGPGASVVCTASYSLTSADLQATQIANTAVATGMIGPAPLSSTPSTATTLLRAKLPTTGADVFLPATLALLLAIAGASFVTMAQLRARRRSA